MVLLEAASALSAAIDFISQIFPGLANPQIGDIIFQHLGLQQSCRRRKRELRRKNDRKPAKKPSCHKVIKMRYKPSKVKLLAQGGRAGRQWQWALVTPLVGRDSVEP